MNSQLAGVKLRIIQEPAPVGASCKIFNPPDSKDPAECTHLKTFYSKVIQNGGEYIPYQKSSFCHGTKVCFEHGKLMIIDGKKALISTGNFDPSSICDVSNGAKKCNRDFAVVSDDWNEVKTLTHIFEHDFKQIPYDLDTILLQSGNSTLTVSPRSLEPLVAFILSAKKRIQIQNQYLKDPNLNQAILNAAKKGVQIEVMVSSICSFGKPSDSVVKKTMELAKNFEDSGINAKAYSSKNWIQGKPGYLHAKTILVDDEKAWVGSVNGSTTALTVNREYGILIDDSTSIQELKSIFNADFKSKGTIALKDDALCSSAP